MKHADTARAVPLDAAFAAPTLSGGPTHWRARRNPVMTGAVDGRVPAAAVPRTRTEAVAPIDATAHIARTPSASLALHIGTLVLDGIPASQRNQVRRAIEGELLELCTGLLREHGTPVDAREMISGVSEFRASRQPDAQGRAIAGAIFRAAQLERPGRERGGN
ncbi:hypothetical protein IQ288_31595 [Burkholderia sp. R-69980]|nr:hypothetical protein [Burkholderia sp. R-69980]